MRLRPTGRCLRNALSLRSGRTSLPPEVLILADAGKQKALLVEQGFLEFGR